MNVLDKILQKILKGIGMAIMGIVVVTLAIAGVVLALVAPVLIVKGAWLDNPDTALNGILAGIGAGVIGFLFVFAEELS